MSDEKGSAASFTEWRRRQSAPCGHDAQIDYQHGNGPAFQNNEKDRAPHSNPQFRPRTKLENMPGSFQETANKVFCDLEECGETRLANDTAGVQKDNIDDHDDEEVHRLSHAPRELSLHHHFIDAWRTQYLEQVLYDSKGYERVVASFTLQCDNTPMPAVALWIKIAQCLSQLDQNPALWGLVLAFLAEKDPTGVDRWVDKRYSRVRIWARDMPHHLLIEICAVILKPFVSSSRHWPNQDFILQASTIDFSDMTNFRHGYDPKVLAWGIANRKDWLSKVEMAWNKNISPEDVEKRRAQLGEHSIRTLIGKHLICLQADVFYSWAQKLQEPNDVIPTTRILQVEDSSSGGGRMLRPILRSTSAYRLFCRIVLWEGDCPDSKWIHCLHREFQMILQHSVLNISPRIEAGSPQNSRSGRMGLFLSFATMADIEDAKNTLRMVFRVNDTLDHLRNPVDAEIVLPFVIDTQPKLVDDSKFQLLTKNQQQKLLEEYRDHGIIHRADSTPLEVGQQVFEAWCSFCRESIPCHTEYFLQRHIDLEWHKSLSNPDGSQGSLTCRLVDKGIHRYGPSDQDVSSTQAWCSTCCIFFSCIGHSGLWMEDRVDAHLNSESHNMHSYHAAFGTADSNVEELDLLEPYF